MKIIAVFMLLHVFLSFAAFGVSLTLLRRSRLVVLTPLVASAAWPAWIVMTQSVAGYVGAADFSIMMCFASLAVGSAWTVIAIVRDREIIAAFPWKQIAACQAIVVLAGLVVLAPHVWHNDFGYFEFGNGEFLNYSQLAAFSLGLQVSEGPVGWETMHQTLRDGVDFINATVSVLTGRHPVYIVEISAALFRTSYLAIVCAYVVGFSRFRTALIVTAAFALSSFDILQFEISFMAASLAASMLVLMAAIVTASHDLSRAQWLTSYVLINLALVISYPEGMAVLKVVEIAFLIQQRDPELTRRYIAGNLIVIATNPWLVWSKVNYVVSTLTSAGGWDFLGHLTYAQRVTGIEPVYLSHLALFRESVSIYVAFLLAACLLAALLYAVWARRFYSILLVPAVVIFLHIAAWAGLKPHMYPAIKITMQWWWIFPVAFAVAMTNRRLYPTAVGFMLIFALLNGATKYRDLAEKLNLPTFYSQHATENIVQTLTSPVALLSGEPIPNWFWLQVLDARGVRVAMTQWQSKLWAREPVGPPTSDPRDGMPLRPGAWLTYTGPALDLVVVKSSDDE